MQIEISSESLDRIKAEYQTAEAALQALDQEFRAIVVASDAPAASGSLTLIERAHAVFAQLPAVVSHRDTTASTMAELEAFATTIAAKEVARLKSEELKRLNKRVMALSEEIDGKRMYISGPLDGDRRMHLIRQFGADLVNQIEERVKAQVMQPTGELVE